MQTFKDWKKIRTEVVILKKEGKDLDTQRITRGKEAKHVDLMISKTSIMTDYAKNKAIELYSEIEQAEKYGLAFVWISAVAFLLSDF